VLVVPFRVFGLADQYRVLPSRALSSWDWLLVQSSCPADVAPVLVRRFHFAVGRFPGCVAFRTAGFAGHG
jgi:allantoicase